MSMATKVREQLENLGIKTPRSEEEEKKAAKLTVCQIVVVVLSLLSVIFLFAPLFYLRDLRFMVAFFFLSFICLVGGIWIWVKQADICENPEEIQD